MDNRRKHFFDIILYLGLFFLLQVVGMTIIMVWGMTRGMQPEEVTENATTLTLATVVGFALVVAVFALLRWSPLSFSYVRQRPWTVLLLSTAVGFGMILPSQWTEELVGMEMPENYQHLFEMMMSNPLGYIAVGLMPPLAEEMVFRGAVLRKLLCVFGDKKAWYAITLSAIAFGAAHGNTAQFAHAGLIGLLMGWMYWKTKSILPGVIVHWVNNSVAFAMVYFMPEMSDAKTIDMFGGNVLAMSFAVSASAIAAVLAIWLLNKHFKKNQEIHEQQ